MAFSDELREKLEITRGFASMETLLCILCEHF